MGARDKGGRGGWGVRRPRGRPLAPERMRKRKGRTDRWRPGPGFSFREGLSLQSAVGPRLGERTCLFLKTQGCPGGSTPGFGSAVEEAGVGGRDGPLSSPRDFPFP